MKMQRLQESKEYKEFLKALYIGNGKYDRVDIFKDLITVLALGISNKYEKDEEKEKYFLKIFEKYSETERLQFAFLCYKLKKIYANNDGIKDILGSIYMELDFRNKELGKFLLPQVWLKQLQK